MPRDLPIANGNMLVAFDSSYRIRDFYYPHIGQENHTAAHYFRLGVWLDGQFSWVHDPPWERHLTYEDRTLVTDVVLIHPQWGIEIQAHDTVDFHENIVVRQFILINRQATVREARLFLHHDFHIYGVDVGDTAFYDPMTRAMIHYKGQRYFLIGGLQAEGPGLHGWATGTKEVNGAEGTWRDAEDGVLEGHAISQGSVDSTVAFKVMLPAEGQEVLNTWICVGTRLEEVRRMHGLVQYKSPQVILDRSRAYWRLWVEKEGFDFQSVPSVVEEQFYRSLLIVRTQIDENGAIVAANDSDIMHYSRDTYSYVWPRDGAWVTAALDQAGYRDLANRFFEFCNQVVESGGFFLQKYNPDRSLSSSWHPWVQQGVPELPIQEDETASVIWALWRHFAQNRDVEVVKPFYRHLIVESGHFMANYRHPQTHLPLDSWDLWEERRGVHTYTVAAVYGGLVAAGNFAHVFGDADIAREFYQAAREVKAAALARLVHPERGTFVRRLAAEADGGYSQDDTPDSSLLLLPRFGLVEATDPVMIKTAEWVREALWVPTDIGGMARYRDDWYQRVAPPESGIPGNPWFICTLWYASHLIDRAASEEDLAPARDILVTVANQAEPSGVLAEQINPYNGTSVSVAPLTWSHAAYVDTVLAYRDKLLSLNRCRTCGNPNGSPVTPFSKVGSG